MSIRILKDLEFEDWAVDHDVTDKMLCEAAKEIESGLVDARLGDYLIKKRVAAPGRSKQRSYRTIVGHRQADRLIFLHGFAKKDKENITKNERKALVKLCEIYMQASDDKLSQMVGEELILEIKCDEQDSKERT